MIKNLYELQSNSKYAFFAQRLTVALKKKKIEPSPILVTSAFNQYTNLVSLKPHTVRKWLLGLTLPRAQTLALLAEWLSLEPQELLKKHHAPKGVMNKVSFEFDFTDQEVISKYLAMTVKQKVTVRLLIDAISDKR